MLYYSNKKVNSENYNLLENTTINNVVNKSNSESLEGDKIESSLEKFLDEKNVIIIMIVIMLRRIKLIKYRMLR